MSEMIAPEKVAANKPEAVQEVARMNQLAGPAQRAESPLHHADLGTIAQKGPKNGGVTLQEHKLLGHLVIRGSQDNQAFLAGAREALGFDLPTAPLSSVQQGDRSVRWISPDEWLLIVPGEEAFDVEEQLRAAMGGHFAIVNVSGGQTVLELSGPEARSVLKKSTPYDVHDRNFPVGKVVTSVFAKTQAVIRRTGEQSWELVIRRSFADYAWLWLQDASAEYGLVVKA
ncbi:sarcosine oxidase subunit gamma [Marinobacterium nitratireducens]|uniref:Sarcosine oxidase subunit gamma n=1 Tax=Marinobacterium nitratireducens TaxID=518897 RepID=A0A918DUL1_9GAMM|nr:sarcosine oxidase subunit gamma family protein [Marinobacterium nitratireducens]GGO84644.1 sarcosine oxidase subunit gamma [Marinobacterium nitratireducens]